MISKDKKYRTVNGKYPARVICVDAEGDFPVILLYEVDRKEYSLSVNSFGCNYGRKMIEEVSVIDWSTVKVDTPIWIKDTYGETIAMHFAKYTGGKVHHFICGYSSHTTDDTTAVSAESAFLENPDAGK